ncbi:MAG: copper resistance protein CopC [Chloroflexota bacterium]|nr:copper resistance protein CopC [Chloroflexota bacterium]
MVSRKQLAGALGALVIGLSVFGAATLPAFAHARYVSHEPALGGAFDGSPVTLKVNFSQELRLASTIRVVNANGTQVDLGDGRVDQDDPDRKAMLVTLPWLQPGVYTAEYVAVSAEDDHAESGSFVLGVGMDPPAAVGSPADSASTESAPAPEPAAPAAEPVGAAPGAATTSAAARRTECPAKANATQ